MRSFITAISLLASACAASGSELPASQDKFLQIVQVAAADYKKEISGANQIRIDQLRDKRASDLCALLNPDDVFGWKGTIEQVSQLDGKIGLTVTIGKDVQLSVSADDPQAISSTSFLAQTLAKLSDGDTVLISGGFEERGKDCFTHKSVEEIEVFVTPTFAFRFDFIEPVVVSEEVADATRQTPRRPASAPTASQQLECRFTIARIAIIGRKRDVIGTGIVDLASRKLQKFDGRWLTKEGSGAADFSELKLELNEDQMLVGNAMLPMLYPTVNDMSPPATYAVIRAQDGTVPFSPNGLVEFPVDGFFRAAFELDGCVAD